MRIRASHWLLVGCVAVVGITCDTERMPSDFDSCPLTLPRATVNNAPVCVCNADRNHDMIISEEELATRPVLTAGKAVFQGCNPDDWVPTGYTYVVAGMPFSVPEVCKVLGEPSTFITHTSVQCADCDCAASCIPKPCQDRCKTTARGCASSQFCDERGQCTSCVPFGTAERGVTRDCGGGCGPCRDGSMCVDGACTGWVRCMVKPSGLCSEKAPTWCPYLAGTIAPGSQCGCYLTFQCGSMGLFSTTYMGTIEF